MAARRGNRGALDVRAFRWDATPHGDRAIRMCDIFFVPMMVLCSNYRKPYARAQTTSGYARIERVICFGNICINAYARERVRERECSADLRIGNIDTTCAATIVRRGFMLAVCRAWALLTTDESETVATEVTCLCVCVWLILYAPGASACVQPRSK